MAIMGVSTLGHPQILLVVLIASLEVSVMMMSVQNRNTDRETWG